MGKTVIFLIIAAETLTILYMTYLLLKQRRLLKFLAADNKKHKEIAAVYWEEEEAGKLRLIRERMELSFLQNQINPHFLYNTLDSIRGRALMDGQAEIARMTEILARFFRYCIGNSDDLVKVREELDHIRDYYYIQKYRFEDRFEIVFEVEDEELYELYLPKMTIQPLVENAMIHGLEKIEKKGLIRLRLFKTQKKLVILISDNGSGMKQEKLLDLNERLQSGTYDVGRKRGAHNGIALSNVNMRLKITFGDASGIRYHSMEGEGTDAMITLPVVDVFERVKYENKFEML